MQSNSLVQDLNSCRRVNFLIAQWRPVKFFPINFFQFYIYIYNWKKWLEKNSTGRHLVIMNLFQLVTTYEELFR